MNISSIAAELADSYRTSDEWARETIHLNYFASLSFPDAVNQAAQAKFAYRGPYGIETMQHEHCRIRAGDLSTRHAPRLSGRTADIRCAAEDGFEPLRQLIQSLTADLEQTGRLYWYDAAEAIGIKVGVRPAFVYLHGARSGPRLAAQALDVPGATSRPWVDISELPACFHHLEPYEAETCLCRLSNTLVRAGR